MGQKYRKEKEECEMRLIFSIIFGALAGWIASKIMKSENNWILNIIVGVVGGFLGGFLLSLIGFHADSIFANLIVSVSGACLFIYIARKFFH